MLKSEIENDEADAFDILAVAICIFGAALGAGLTMGLMSIDKTKLQIIQMTGSPRDAAAANTIMPLLENHHLLLVTLLLFNAVANEAMPVFLEALLPPYVAVLLSVTLVLIFGEIIPSALFTGKNQILLAAKLSSFVWCILYILYPITIPISTLLDFTFGHSTESPFSRYELEALVILQNAACRDEYAARGGCRRKGGNDDEEAPPSALSRDEIGIMTGVLRLSQLTAKDAMIPICNVSMISSDLVLDEKALHKIMSVGFSRYPVFEESNREFLLGYLLVKTLIVVNPSDKRLVSSLELREPIVVHPSEDLLAMLNIFQEGRSHLALVSLDPETTLRCIQEKVAPVNDDAKVLGIITLENIIEKIIQEEIYDEMDHQSPGSATSMENDSHCTEKKIRSGRRRALSSASSLGSHGGSRPDSPIHPSLPATALPELVPLLLTRINGNSSYRGYGGGETLLPAPVVSAVTPRRHKQRPALPADLGHEDDDTSPLLRDVFPHKTTPSGTRSVHYYGDIISLQQSGPLTAPTNSTATAPAPVTGSGAANTTLMSSSDERI